MRVLIRLEHLHATISLKIYERLVEVCALFFVENLFSPVQMVLFELLRDMKRKLNRKAFVLFDILLNYTIPEFIDLCERSPQKKQLDHFTAACSHNDYKYCYLMVFSLLFFFFPWSHLLLYSVCLPLNTTISESLCSKNPMIVLAASAFDCALFCVYHFSCMFLYI